MSDVTSLLIALGNSDPSIRLPAEETVVAAREADLGGFLIALLMELRDESKPSVARFMAGTILKNSIAPNIRDVSARRELDGRWRCISSEVRSKVKQEVLETLGSAVKEVRIVAANIVGSLSRIEIPLGEWPDLLPILFCALENGNDQHQESALTAIGYICEEASEHDDVEDVLRLHASNILSAIMRGMASGNENVRYYATNALCNAMEFIQDNMEQRELRDQLIAALCNAAKEAASQRIREKAMESLAKVADMYYTTLPNYISMLHTITSNAIFNDVESVALQAMLFWIAICETEAELQDGDKPETCLNYALNGANDIAAIALKAMLQQEEDQTEDSWNISIAGGKLLQALSLCIRDPVIPIVLPFVYKNIGSQDWREKEAAIMAYGCILNGPEPHELENSVAQAVPGLLEHVRHTHPMIADTTGWVLAVVCEVFPLVFLSASKNLQDLMSIVGPMIGMASQSEDHAMRATRACQIVHNLALAYEEEETLRTNGLSMYFQDLVTVLLLAIDNYGEHNVRGIAQETLNALVDGAATDCFLMLQSLVPCLHERLDRTLQLRQSGSVGSNESLIMLGLFCGALGAVARKLEDGFVEPYLDTSMNLLIRIFHSQTNTVLDEALCMLGCFSHVAKERLLPYLDAVMPFLLRGLETVDEPELVTVAVGTVGDLSLGLKVAFAPYVGPVLGILLTKLQNPAVERDLKCSFLGCLGDIALNVGGSNFAPYVEPFMGVANELFVRSCAVNITDDLEMEEYVMSLWESLAEFFTGVCQSFRGGEVSLLRNYFKNMLDFAIHIAGNAREYTDVFNAGVALVGDMACVLRSTPAEELRQAAKQVFATQVVADLIQYAFSAAHDGETKKQVQWVSRQLQLLQQS